MPRYNNRYRRPRENDELFYNEWCYTCAKRTEHEHTGACCACVNRVIAPRPKNFGSAVDSDGRRIVWLTK